MYPLYDYTNSLGTCDDYLILIIRTAVLSFENVCLQRSALWECQLLRRLVSLQQTMIKVDPLFLTFILYFQFFGTALPHLGFSTLAMTYASVDPYKACSFCQEYFPDVRHIDQYCSHQHHPLVRPGATFPPLLAALHFPAKYVRRNKI